MTYGVSAFDRPIIAVSDAPQLATDDATRQIAADDAVLRNGNDEGEFGRHAGAVATASRFVILNDDFNAFGR